jgi:hypothetical protein
VGGRWVFRGPGRTRGRPPATFKGPLHVRCYCGGMIGRPKWKVVLLPSVVENLIVP